MNKRKTRSDSVKKSSKKEKKEKHDSLEWISQRKQIDLESIGLNLYWIPITECTLDEDNHEIEFDAKNTNAFLWYEDNLLTNSEKPTKKILKQTIIQTWTNYAIQSAKFSEKLRESGPPIKEEKIDFFFVSGKKIKKIADHKTCTLKDLAKLQKLDPINSTFVIIYSIPEIMGFMKRDSWVLVQHLDGIKQQRFWPLSTTISTLQSYFGVASLFCDSLDSSEEDKTIGELVKEANLQEPVGSLEFETRE